MPSTTVYNMAGEAVEQLELSEQVFGVIPNVAVLHQVVTAQLVNRRQGNASTKTRSEVSGGNKKPYKQKGTGHARQGSTRAPQFRHGGTVFGPKPHKYHHDVPKKMRRLAIRSALSDKVANEQLIVVNELALETPRTKDMLALLAHLPISGKKVLMMLPRRDENIVLSTRNIPTAKVQHVSSINVVELLKHDCVIMPRQTVRWIELVFGEGLSAEEATQRIADQSEAEAGFEPETESDADTETPEALEESASQEPEATPEETTGETSESGESGESSESGESGETGQEE
ncbi:MAG TPA: 50S ribosomal protein L4 [Ktedonobacteraceae bacterium]|nr:50S ribosomal protein L4 [Ktedonobacteraceae bacterium]